MFIKRVARTALAELHTPEGDAALAVEWRQAQAATAAEAARRKQELLEKQGALED